MKRAPLLTLAGFASLTLLATSAVIGSDHDWNGYHWNQTPVFTLTLGDNVEGVWDAHLANASSDWNNPLGGADKVLETSVVTGGTNAKRCKAATGNIEICSRAYGYNGWLGLAQIWLDDGHITKGIVKVNDSYFDLSAYNTPAWRQMVMCQEIGHVFGLDHTDENFDNQNDGTCMDYTSDPLGVGSGGPLANTAPNAGDFQILETIYNHPAHVVSGGGGMGGGPPGGPPGMGGGMGGAPETPPGLDDLDLSQPGQWGRLIASSADGRTAVFELDFGNGIRVRTFVIWA